MPGLLPNVDPDGLLEYSVVYTDRALNHMSKRFQGVMRDISGILKEVYHAKSAVLNIASHPECYACHSPNSGDQKASQKSGCVVCHTQTATNVQPFSAKYISKAYGALFTHKEHVGYTKGNCYECHTINGAYNQASPASLKVKQHVTPDQRSGKGCFSCHDGGTHLGRTVFSGEPGSTGGGSCNRCHTREDFKVLPSSGR